MLSRYRQGNINLARFLAPKSQIKIVCGDLHDDFIIDVKLSVPKWLIKKILLGNYLKMD
jgi:hypothetical protein